MFVEAWPFLKGCHDFSPAKVPKIAALALDNATQHVIFIFEARNPF